MAEPKYGPEVVDRICELLAEGRSLRDICSEEGMPGRVTVWRWGQGDDDIAARIRDAGEVGYVCLGEKLFADILACDDPHKGRKDLEAAKWFLGSRSHAYRTKPLAVGAVLNVGADDAFDAVARLMDQAAEARTSGLPGPREVDEPSETGAADADGQLGHLAGAGRTRVGED